MDEQTLKELEKENLELKLASLRKEILILREDLTRHLNLILDQTSKTNGSVARVMQQIHEIDQANENRDRDIQELKEHRKGTKFWYTLQTNKWIVVPVILAFYALSRKEILELIIKLVT